MSSVLVLSGLFVAALLAVRARARRRSAFEVKNKVARPDKDMT